MFWHKKKPDPDTVANTHVVMPNEVRSREIIQKSRENLYKEVVEDLRAEQVGKENQIIIDQNKLTLMIPLTRERINDELGIPPYTENQDDPEENEVTRPVEDQQAT